VAVPPIENRFGILGFSAVFREAFSQFFEFFHVSVLKSCDWIALPSVGISGGRSSVAIR
jgi:hypothetical protein